MCTSYFIILACIRVCTFRVNKAEEWHLIYRAQSGSVACGADPATRPVYETTSPSCCFMLKMLIALYARVLELLHCTTHLNSQSLNFASTEAGTSVWFYLKELSLRTLVCLCLSACLPAQYFALYLWHVNTYGVNSYRV